MVERKRGGKPLEIRQDPGFARHFLSFAKDLDRRFGFSDVLGLTDSKDRQTLEMALAARAVRDELFASGGDRYFAMSGVHRPIIVLWHRYRLGIRNPHKGAQESLDAIYREHMQASYMDGEIERALHIQTAVNQLVTQFTVNPWGNVIRWKPNTQIIEAWSQIWRPRFLK